ncbi:hypothetical protein C8R46DRAFT_1006501 [Mycena filopes]|nr:hypothetical protein C8R46DRAFT_1006501 [Mycena filopes]
MAAHLFGFYVREWMQVADSISQYRPVSHTWTLWIRSSSGRLCADIMVPNGDHILDYPNRSIPDVHGPTVFDAKNDETLAIHCLSLQQYHSICARLNQRRSSFPSTAGTLFTLGAVVSWPMPPASEDLRDVGHEIAFLPDVPCECSGWLVSGKGAVGNLMGNGWMRYDVDELFNTGREFMLFVEAPQLDLGGWLPQANNVFSSQHIISNWEDYTLKDRVCFKVIVGNPTAACPPGYLFLCPEEDFQVGTSSFKWPDNPAYWSLDASGVERLSTKEATELGFPPLELSTRVQGYAWDASIYAGLRKFHQAKGFDPESQEVARHLGLPLYRLPGNIGFPFAHGESTAGLSGFICPN